jgi:hypothetical protein
VVHFSVLLAGFFILRQVSAHICHADLAGQREELVDLK